MSLVTKNKVAPLEKKEKFQREAVPADELNANKAYRSSSLGSIDFNHAPTPPEEAGPEIGQIYFSPSREKWLSPSSSLVSLLGFALDLSNVWRFPYLCFRYKATFLIPYSIMAVFFGFPLLYLELLIGQFTREGPIGMWKICPILRGTGIAILLVTYIVTYAYNTILAWTLLFAANAITTPLPWSTCDNDWNTPDCIEVPPNLEQTMRNGSFPGTEFYYNNVIQTVDYDTGDIYELAHLGSPIVANYLYLSFCYLILIFFLLGGLKNSTKVMWFSTLLPVVLLTMLAFRVTLAGSAQVFQLVWDTSTMANIWSFEMWVAAGEQVFFSTGLGFGVHITFGSINDFHHNIFRDSAIVTAVNALTSILALIVACSFIGSEAFVIRKTVQQALEAEKEFIFEICADALARLPNPYVFAFFFYLMVFLLAFSCVLGAFQTILLAIRDELVRYNVPQRKRWYGGVLVVSVLANYGVGLISLAKGGHSLFSLINENAPSSSLLFCGLVQNVGLSWLYGTDYLCYANQVMLSKMPPFWIRVCWKYICPSVFLILIIGGHITEFQDRRERDVHLIGWVETTTTILISFVPALICVLLTIYYTCKQKGHMKYLCLISPEIEHPQIQRTMTGARGRKRHWSFIGTRKQMLESELLRPFFDTAEAEQSQVHSYK